MSTEQQSERPAKRLDDHHSVWWTKPQPEDDMTEGQGQDASPENGTIDLIRFLKKTPPPPTNYMSIPDDTSSSSRSEGDKWDKFKFRLFRHHRHRQRTRRRRRPPVIKLPDSAVAATTIDGHRYIAISIPIEYSHLAPLPNNQYPVYDSIGAAFKREIDFRFPPWRNLSSNRIVTVLDPVTEDREPSTSGLPSQKPRTAQVRVLNIPRRRPQPRLSSLPSAQEQRYAPHKSTRPAKRRVAEDVPKESQTGLDLGTATNMSQRRKGKDALRPDEPGTSVTDFTGQGEEARKGANEGDQLSEGKGTTSRRHKVAAGSTSLGIRTLALSELTSESFHNNIPPKPIITITVPSRTSSRRETSRAEAAAAAPPPAEGAEHAVEGSSGPSPSGNGYRSNGNGSSNSNSNGAHNRPRGSFAESIVTNAYSPQLMKAQTAVVVRPAADTCTGGKEVERPESPLDLNAAEYVSKNAMDSGAQLIPLEAEKLVYLMPAGAAAAQSRKDSVREKKLRDVEKLRAKIHEQQEQEREEGEEVEETGEASTSQKVPAAKSTPALNLRKVASENDLGLRSSSPPSLSLGERERARKRKEKGKGKEGRKPAAEESQRYTFMRDMPASLPKLHPSAILGSHQRPHHHQQQQQQQQHLSTSATPLTSSSTTTTTTPSYLSAKSSSSPSPNKSPALSPSHTPSSASSPSSAWQRRTPNERRQRYIAHALAEERETLENLSRSELLQRYEALREQRAYERERRLRKLERARDAWVSCVPVLLENLNILLREQSALLERAGLAAAPSSTPASAVSAGASARLGRERRRKEQKRAKEEESENESSSPNTTGGAEEMPGRSRGSSVAKHEHAAQKTSSKDKVKGR